MQAPVASSSKTGPLSNVVAMVSMGDNQKAEETVALLKKLGAQFMTKMGGRVTHLVWSKEGDPKVYWNAVGQKVLIVPKSWVSQCEEDEEHADASNFTLMVKSPPKPDPPAKASKLSMAPKKPNFNQEPASSSQRFPESSRQLKPSEGAAITGDLDEEEEEGEEEEEASEEATTEAAEVTDADAAISEAGADADEGGEDVADEAGEVQVEVAVRGDGTSAEAHTPPRPSNNSKDAIKQYLEAKRFPLPEVLNITRLRQSLKECDALDARNIDTADASPAAPTSRPTKAKADGSRAQASSVSTPPAPAPEPEAAISTRSDRNGTSGSI